MSEPLPEWMTASEWPKRYRCSKGHEWEEGYWQPSAQRLSFTFDGKRYGPYCMRCLQEFCAAHAGIVTQVLPGPTESESFEIKKQPGCIPRYT